MQLGTVLGRELHVDEYVGFALVQQAGELGNTRADLIGHAAPLLAGSRRVVLGERGTDPGGDDAPLDLAGIGQGVAHKCTRQRYQVAFSTLLIAALSLSCASETTSSAPRIAAPTGRPSEVRR